MQSDESILEDEIYRVRSLFYSLDINEWCATISRLCKEYFVLTGQEFRPATYSANEED